MNLCNVRSNGHFITTPFQNLQFFSLDDRFSEDCGFLNRNVAELLHSNPQLQSIELIANNNREMTMNKLLQMIKNNAAVTKLEVKIYSSVFLVNLSDVEQLANEHLSLTELKLWRYQITADNVNALIRHLSTLKKLSFWVQNAAEYREVETNVGSGWKMDWPANCFGPQYVQLIRNN